MKNVLAIAEGLLPSTELGIIQPFDFLKKKGIIKYDLGYVRDILRD
ncbi:MAG TPA: hypothetical protein P5136_02250 [Methanofastidiosum sp.]|nr:hypothetical protein [Methanofastidiosum sp.]